MNGWVFIRLVHSLRQASVSISSQDIREAQICFHRYPDISEKLIIRSLFIHHPQDLAIFETVWGIIVDKPNLEEKRLFDGKSQQVLKKQDELSVGGQGVGRGWGGISLTQMGRSPDAADISARIPMEQIAELVSSGLEFEDCVNDVMSNLDYYSWINSYDLAYQRRQLSEEEWNQHLESRSSLLHEIRMIVLSAQITVENSWQPLVRQHWMFKSLNSLTEKEKTLVKLSIRKWSRKLALRPGSHWKKSRRGTIDIRQSIRQSAQWNGVIFRLSYRQKSLRSSELIVLCDVSNSMSAFVEFLIYLVACLRKRFRKTRVFFFIDSLWDITDFEWEDDQSLKQEIKSWGHKISSGYSDYGAVFKELAATILRNVGNRTNLVILGDAKNNYKPAQAEYLAMIAERVRKVIWLNPLNVVEWKERDNKMPEYESYCTNVYQCRSASDLQRIVREVF